MFQVMIVDDEKAIRENLPALINFEAHGFRVCGTAKNGQDALEKWESCRPDAIFLDVRMPVMDGLTFLGKLQERTQTLPDIVMLSGYSDLGKNLLVESYLTTFSFLDFGKGSAITYLVMLFAGILGVFYLRNLNREVEY